MQDALGPRTLTQLLASDQVATMHKAIVASLAALCPGVAVRRHPGRMDIADFVAQDFYAAPTVAVAATRIRAAHHHEGSYAVPVDWTAYLIVEDKVVGERRVERADVASAIGGWLLRILQHGAAARWGLADITDPDADPEPELKPVFTADSYRKGVGLYAVTWRQGLIVAGDPLWDFASAPPPDMAPPSVLLPGDPGWDGGAS